jgi:ferritin-like metal-binding protein YciE
MRAAIGAGPGFACVYIQQERSYVIESSPDGGGSLFLMQTTRFTDHPADRDNHSFWAFEKQYDIAAKDMKSHSKGCSSSGMHLCYFRENHFPTLNFSIPRGMIFPGTQKKYIMPTTTEKSPKSTQNSKLRQFFIDQLQDIYWAEQKLVKTLPKLSEAAHSQELKNAFDSHLKETESHVSRIEQAFSLLKEKANAQECPAIKGIAEEGEEIIDQTEDKTAQRDVGLIFAGQKAEHYEIATYGALIELAKEMGEEEVADLFEETLAEEKNADEKLTQLATGGINREAAAELAE